MRLLTNISILSALAACSLNAADPLPLDPFWKSETFRKSMTGSYGLDARIEPRITEDEAFYLEEASKLMGEDDRAAAIEKLEDADLVDRSPAIRFALANLQFEEGLTEEAAENFAKTLEQFPNFRDAHRNYAVVLVQQEEFDEAKKHLVRAIELGSRDGVTTGLLGYCHLLDKNYQAALQAYRLAQMTAPGERQWKQGEAQALQNLEQPAAAASLYREMLRDTPETTELWMNLADAAIQLDQQDRAVSALEIAHRLGGLDGNSLLTLGHLYLDEDLPGEALARYREALADQPRPSLDSAIKGLDYLTAHGHWPQAKDFVDIIGIAYPDAESPRLARATALVEFETGDKAAALARLEELSEKDPTDGQALLLLARFHHREGERERAEMLLDQAALLDEFEADALTQHGKLLVEAGDYEKAAEKLDRAVQIEPSPYLEEYLVAVKGLAKSPSAQN